MTKEERTKCHAIIHVATLAAGGVGSGLAQLPGSDTVPITAIQVGMVISLGAVFGMKIEKSVATSIVGGFLSAASGRFISQILVGWIPGLGNIINAGSAVAITEALGWEVAENFAKEAEQNGEEDE